MKQITRWDDLVGKTITGSSASDGILVMEDGYCVFCVDEWDELAISDDQPSRHTLRKAGIIDEKEYARLEQQENDRTKAWELRQLAYLKAKYEEKDGNQE